MVNNNGAVFPSQKGKIGGKFGVITGTTVIDMEVNVAETHCPAVGLNVYCVVPIFEVFTVGGFHVPVTGIGVLSELVGKTGAGSP